MQRVITILLGILVIFNIYVFLNENSIALLVGTTLLMPLIGVFYGVARKWETGGVDRLIYFASVLGGFSDISIYLNYRGNGELSQITLACIVHLIYIIVFQREGTHVYSLGRKNLLKLAIPAGFVFFFFGFVLLKVIPDTVFVVTVLYAFELFILIVLGLFRPVNKKSYWIGVTGVTLILIKDVFYSEFHFINENPFIHSIMDITNALAYYCITWSIAINQNDKSSEPNYVGIVSKFVRFLRNTNIVKFIALRVLNLRYQLIIIYRNYLS